MKKYKFVQGDRVSRLIDVYGPNVQHNIRTGTILLRYKKIGDSKSHSDLYIIGYPELYAVLWDDGSVGKAFLPHGLNKTSVQGK